MSSSAATCVICTDGIKQSFACQFCSKTCCMTCAKRHALAQAELIRKPCCLFDDCRREFTDEFVDGAYPTAWRRNELRRTREDALAVQAMAMLPNKQALAKEFGRQLAKVEAARANPEVAKALAEPSLHGVKAIDAKIRDMRTEITRLSDVRTLVGVAQRPTSALLKDARWMHLRSTPLLVARAAPAAPAAPEEEPEEPPQHRVSMRCPAQGGCNGFVEAAAGGVPNRGMCGMCGITVCHMCERQVLPPPPSEEGGEGGGEQSHVCTPEDLQSVKAIAKDTKPCPSCGVRIYKSYGCSQMWCTACHKPFDWNSGAPINSGERIHNPHYFAWREAGGVANPLFGGAANPPAGGGCGRRFNYVELPPALGRDADQRRLNTILRLILDCRGSVQPAMHRKFVECQQNEEDSAACQFLTNMIDERAFKSRCFLRDRHRAFHEEQQRILDAACECAMDVLRGVSTPQATADAVDQAFEQLRTLRAHFNDTLRNKLSKRFERSTYVINEDWSMELDKCAKRPCPAAGEAAEAEAENNTEAAAADS